MKNALPLGNGVILESSSSVSGVASVSQIALYHEYSMKIENAKAQSVFRKVIENESSKIGSKSVS